MNSKGTSGGRKAGLPLHHGLLSLLLAGVFQLAALAQNAPTDRSAGTPPPEQILNRLTREERAWLRDHPVITVAHDPDWAPVEFSNERGELTGMSGDYLSLVEQRLGVQFKRIPNLSWQEAFARQKRWEIDLAPCVAAASGRSNFWAFTQPYLSIPIVIATRSEVGYIGDMKELFSKKVAVVKSYAIDDWVTHDFPEINLVRFNTVPEGLAALQRGEVFAYLDNLLIIGDYQAKLKVANVKIAGQTPYVNAQRMAVRKDWAPLAGILDKALASIPETERHDIYRKWVPIRYEHGFNYALFWKMLAGFAVILLALVVWNWKLAKEIQQRQRAEAALSEAEQRSRLMAEASFEGIAVTEQGVLLDCSKQLALMLGYGHAELVGKPVASFIAPEHCSRVAEAQSSGRLEPYEHLMLRADGTKFPVEVRARSAQIGGRQVRITAVRDITEHMRSKLALQLTQYSIDQASDAVFWMNREGGFSYVNDQACRSLGYSRDELVKLCLWDIDPVYPKALWFERWAAYQEDRRGGAERLESSHRRKDGRQFPVEVVAKHLWLGDAEVHVAFVRDITERKRAEEAIHDREQRLRLAITAANQGLYDLNVQTGDATVSPEYATMLGYDPATFRETNAAWIERLHPDDHERVATTYRDYLAGKLPHYQVEFRQRTVAGDWKWILSLGKLISRDPTGQPLRMLGTHTDITARKAAEEALRRSEANLQLALEAARLGDWSWDIVTGEVVWSARCKSLYGLSPETVVTYERFLQCLHPEDRGRVDAALRRAVEERSDYDVEKRAVWPDGSVHWTSTRGRVFCNAAGEPVRVAGVTLDITDRKQSEQALRESEFLLRKSQAVAKLGSYYLDARTGQWIGSAALDEILGIGENYPKDVAGWITLVHPEEKEEMLQYLSQHVLAGRNRFEKQYRIIRHRDGEERWVNGLGELEFDGEGNPIKMIGTIQDITERKRAEAALRESEQRFAVFMENLPAGAFMKDVPGAVVYANRYLCDLFGWGNVVGRSTRDLLPPEVAEKMEAEDRAALAHGPITVTEQVRDAANRERVFQTSKFPIARVSRPPLLGGITVDITERKQAEEALRTSLAEKVVLLKEVHHRVKNNLQIVSSLLNLQARQVQNPEAQAFLRDTQGRIQAMSLLHEALYGSNNLARVTFRNYVQTVCRQVSRAYASDARNIRVRQDVADVQLPLDQAIPAGLILNELLSNALKHAFTGRPQGEITVQLQPVGEQNYALRVTDDGVGLPADTDSKDTATLGLRLVENLVRQLEGELTVIRESGTAFQIIFPIQHS